MSPFDGYDAEDDRRQTDDRRRHVVVHSFPTWQAIGVILALALQFGAVIWFAATTRGGLDDVKEQVAETRGTIGSLSQQATTAAIRLGVLESKVDDIRSEQRDVERGKRR